MNQQIERAGTVLAQNSLSRISVTEAETRKEVFDAAPKKPYSTLGAIVDLRDRADVRGLRIYKPLGEQRLDDGYGYEVVFVVDDARTAIDAAVDWNPPEEVRWKFVECTSGEPIVTIALRECNADWYFFPNADDEISPGYVRNLRKYVSDPVSSRSSVVSTKFMVHRQSGGWKQSWQKFKFVKNTVLNLDRTTYVVQAHGASTVFAAEAVGSLDTSILEDSNLTLQRLIGALLLAEPMPMLGIAPKSVYLAYGDSEFAENEVATSSSRRHATQLARTYGALFDSIPDGEPVPEWLGTMFLYELALLLKREPRLKTRLAGLTREEHDQFFDALMSCLIRIPDNWIYSLRYPTMSVEARNMLLALKNDTSTTHTFPVNQVRVARLDLEQDLALIRYFFTGPLPDEQFWVGGSRVASVASKIKTVALLRQDRYFERLVWVPASSWLQIELDGVRQQVVMRAFSNADYQVTRSALRNEFAAEPRRPEITPTENKHPNQSTPNSGAASSDEATKSHVMKQTNPIVVGTTSAVRKSIFVRLADSLKRRTSGAKNRSATPPVSKADSRPRPSSSKKNAPKPKPKQTARRRAQTYAYAEANVRKFAEAWVLMDRVNMAQDSAEHLYRYIMNEHSEINLWYILDETSVDWARLEAEGFKLIAYGSRDHEAVYMNASHVISSHLSPEVVSPIPIDYYQSKVRPWKTTFLQHGVTKDDMSHWLNQRTIDTLVTATQDEYGAFVNDYTPYVVTDKEVILSGFPRHDSLIDKRHDASNARQIDTILIAPTWRDSLLKPKGELGTLRELVDDFAETPYATDWSGVLTDENLLRAARDHECRVVLLPHPNMQDAVDQFTLGDDIQIIRYEDGDIQELLARTRLLVTDYSSLSFEAGIIDAPVVYFQSDRDQVFSGKHTYSPGYYDYLVDGFGPVTENIRETGIAVRNLLSQIESLNGAVPEPYATRISDTFVMRGQSSCKLVYDAIKNTESPTRSISRPVTLTAQTTNQRGNDAEMKEVLLND